MNSALKTEQHTYLLKAFIDIKINCLGFFSVQRFFVANSSKQVYFEQQILTLLLVYPTPNLSCIKFAHISGQVKGFFVFHVSKLTT